MTIIRELTLFVMSAEVTLQKLQPQCPRRQDWMVREAWLGFYKEVREDTHGTRTVEVDSKN